MKRWYAVAAAIGAAAIALAVRPPHGAPVSVVAAPLNGASSGEALVSPHRLGHRAHVHASAAPRDLVVYVAGAVAHPGLYHVGNGARAADAVARAGGTTPDADPVAVNLAALLRDGDEIAVVPRATPHRTVRTGGIRHAGAAAASVRASRGRAARPPAEIAVDLNTASEEDLRNLPGIGPALAARIVAYREENGPFASVDELLDVSGVTESRLAQLEGFAVVK